MGQAEKFNVSASRMKYDQAVILDGARIGKKIMSGIWLHIGRQTTIGDNCEFGASCTIGDSVNIEEGVSLGDTTSVLNKAQIGASTKIGSKVVVHEAAIISGNVTIGSCSTIGSDCRIEVGAEILPGSTVPDRAIILENSRYFRAIIKTKISQPKKLVV